MNSEILKKVPEEVLQQSSELNFYPLADKVMKMKGEYITKFHSLPRYIKMPANLGLVLSSYGKKFISVNIHGDMEFCGLQVCTTWSITSENEIEVF